MKNESVPSWIPSKSDETPVSGSLVDREELSAPLSPLVDDEAAGLMVKNLLLMNHPSVAVTRPNTKKSIKPTQRRSLRTKTTEACMATPQAQADDTKKIRNMTTKAGSSLAH